MHVTQLEVAPDWGHFAIMSLNQLVQVDQGRWISRHHVSNKQVIPDKFSGYRQKVPTSNFDVSMLYFRHKQLTVVEEQATLKTKQAQPIKPHPALTWNEVSAQVAGTVVHKVALRPTRKTCPVPGWWRWPPIEKKRM
jgi:hypothetical protein